MKNLYKALIAFFVLFFGTCSLFAAENDYKNNLLKVEVTKTGDNSYDIGLYTQKTYNEPVKVIKKTDTVYYLLLPETGHSITSVPPVEDVKNVSVKSYPYAGQDMQNAYTKVAIITSKPVKLSTSLRTLDSSISPRLDPLRLAKLDQVFERYSQRLAQNNIPTPLAEFRKASSNLQKPVLQNETKIVSNPKPAIKEPEALPKQTVRLPQATKSFEEYQNKSNKIQAAANAKRAQAKTVQKPVVSALPAQKAPMLTVKKQENPAPVKKQEQAQTPENQLLANAPSKTSAPDIKEEQPADKDVVKEYEKQLPTTEPTEVEFDKKVPVDTDESKGINAEVIEPDTNQKDISPNIIVNQDEQGNQAPQNNNIPLLGGVFGVLLILYLLSKKAGAKKRAETAKNAAAQNVREETEAIKELLKAKMPPKKEEPPVEQTPESFKNELAQSTQTQSNGFSTPDGAINPVYNTVPNMVNSTDSIVKQSADEISDEEKVRAFNAYMDSITKDDEYDEVSYQTEDDKVIQQLYTPIESKYTAVGYGGELSQGAATGVLPAESEVATIISSLKLTETRGLSLAKFEGITSLIGYIQDDIYVLYSFKGDVEQPEIEARLAQENDAESVYIVETGGKKFMVKSSPFEISLEMEM